MSLRADLIRSGMFYDPTEEQKRALIVAGQQFRKALERHHDERNAPVLLRLRAADQAALLIRAHEQAAAGRFE